MEPAAATPILPPGTAATAPVGISVESPMESQNHMLQAHREKGILNIQEVPIRFRSLEDYLEWESRPSQGLVNFVQALPGPHHFCLEGGTGKGGPSQALLLRRALDLAGITDAKVQVIGRYSGSSGNELRTYFKDHDIIPLIADIGNPDDLNTIGNTLRETPYHIYMVGRKFNTATTEGREELWHTNTAVPIRFFETLKGSQCRVSFYESGNVLGASSIEEHGATAHDSMKPSGEYGYSVLARNRLTQYYAREYDLPIARGIYYYGIGAAGIDGLYGTLRDIAHWVFQDTAVPLTSPKVNWIWQNNVSELMIRLLGEADTTAPAFIVTSDQILDVKDVAVHFADKFGSTSSLSFIGERHPTAILGDARDTLQRIPVEMLQPEKILEIIANWFLDGLPDANRPTGFQKRPDLGENF